MVGVTPKCCPGSNCSNWYWGFGVPESNSIWLVFSSYHRRTGSTTFEERSGQLGVESTLVNGKTPTSERLITFIFARQLFRTLKKLTIWQPKLTIRNLIRVMLLFSAPPTGC